MKIERARPVDGYSLRRSRNDRLLEGRGGHFFLPKICMSKLAKATIKVNSEKRSLYVTITSHLLSLKHSGVKEGITTNRIGRAES